MRRVVSILFILLAIVAGVSFAVLNAQPVVINYYTGSREVPLAFIIVLAFAAGAILGVVGSLFRVARMSREARRLRRQVRNVEKEVVRLRPIPLEHAD